MPVDPAEGAGVMNSKVLGGIYWGLSAFAVLQLVRTVLSRTRRVWSLQSAFLALCLTWSGARAVYFSFVFAGSESCAGFSCTGGSDDGAECNAGRGHPAAAGECPGGECLSNSALSCAGQHLLFGLPTMIQSFMLSTLVVFYSYWVHKANVSVHHRDQGPRMYRRRVLLLCGAVNGVYYLCFATWVFGMRCAEEPSGWIEASVGREVMAVVTACMFYTLCGAMAYVSWRLYTHSQRIQSSSPTGTSGRRKVMWINMGIVLLFTAHGTLSLASLSPDRQDVLPCPLLLFPDALIAILGEVIPTLVLLLHFRRISQPSMNSPSKDPSYRNAQSHPSMENQPTRPEDAYLDDSTSSDSGSDITDEDAFGAHGKGSQAVFDDLNRYEERLTGVFQSSPCFNQGVSRVAAVPSKAARALLMGDGQGLGRALLTDDALSGAKGGGGWRGGAREGR